MAEGKFESNTTFFNSNAAEKINEVTVVEFVNFEDYDEDSEVENARAIDPTVASVFYLMLVGALIGLNVALAREKNDSWDDYAFIGAVVAGAIALTRSAALDLVEIISECSDSKELEELEYTSSSSNTP